MFNNTFDKIKRACVVKEQTYLIFLNSGYEWQSRACTAF